MRNIFKGGPLDGNVIMTDIITNGGEFVTHLPIEEYDGSDSPVAGIDGVYQRTWVWTGIGADGVINEEVASESGLLPPEPAQKKPAASAAPKAGGGAPVEKSDLRARREAIKLSRGPLAERAELSVGVIARIETKGGTEEEVAAYTTALEHYENAQ